MKDLFVAGGIVMYPLSCLSIHCLATNKKQAWFWTQLLAKENLHIQQILEAAAVDWHQARDLAAKCQD
ncbi:MAG: MotA/TolQ/ExbB proton channel family protein, partial [Pseudanabaenaceae cyanobacterium]